MLSPFAQFALCSLLALPALAVSVPAGTEVQLRLTSEVSSDQPSGTAFTAVVIAPVLVKGVPVIAIGTQVNGVTADAHPNQAAVNGESEVPATLRLQVSSLHDAAGHSTAIAAAVAGIDNARESVDAAGLMTGITASRTFTALADAGINKLEAKSSGFGGFLGEIKKSLVKPADPAIDYKAGVEFTIKLTQALDWTPVIPAVVPPPITPAEVISGIVAQLPFRTVALKPPMPSDLVNLLFIGSRDQIESAFKAAGWFASDPLGRVSTFHTAQAIIQNDGYNEAPMSVLTLDGRPPDMTFEKQNNTFASRHHIRIWQVQPIFAGQPIFVAAATHDIKIYFSQTSNSITHGIDPNIDRERAKVTNDLVFTGRIQAVSLIRRSNLPKDISNATGDQLETDDQIAALQFKP
ncbi:MAG TPA: LssY C-terminal domain-containing protein [Bryobacteraceae bacterium]|jgi:hypothetical protein|nr:LssY C-terminal domain-containing protein [Bryobacteraceae bacterium]